MSVPAFAITALERQKAAQKKAKLKAGSKWIESGLVFPSSIGTAVDERNVRREFAEILRAAKLPHMPSTICVTPARRCCSRKACIQGSFHVMPALGADAAQRMNDLVGVKSAVKSA